MKIYLRYLGVNGRIHYTVLLFCLKYLLLTREWCMILRCVILLSQRAYKIQNFYDAIKTESTFDNTNLYFTNYMMKSEH